MKGKETIWRNSKEKLILDNNNIAYYVKLRVYNKTIWHKRYAIRKEALHEVVTTANRRKYLQAKGKTCSQCAYFKLSDINNLRQQNVGKCKKLSMEYVEGNEVCGMWHVAGEIK